MRTVAAFLSRGGLGDCGQHAVAHSLSDSADVTVCAIAREVSTHHTVEGKPLPSHRQHAQALEHGRLQERTLDYAADAESPEGAAAMTQLQAALAGADAVIACPSNRWPCMERRAAASMRNIVEAMQAVGVKRLVYVSTVGVDSRPLPWSCSGTLFAAVLACAQGTKADFRSADAVVRESALDRVIVRPTGLDPREVPIGKWKVLPALDKVGPLAANIAKADVGQFLLQEAVHPTLHGEDVQIGCTREQMKESRAQK
jgi:nucleoside-diphosphate-sugar epimerase